MTIETVEAPATKKNPRARKSVVPPAVIKEGMSVFDYLQKCTPPLHQKIIDIACSQAMVPVDLRKDAGQEIAMMWAQMKPDTKKFKPGQIASYAHRMAKHAALRLRRELGSSVRLPGSAFRKKKDGTSYVNPGVLSSALDWNELENWFQTDELPDNPAQGAFSGVNSDAFSSIEEESVDPGDSEEAQKAERLELLNSRSKYLTPRQVQIMKALIEGASYEDIMVEHDIKRGVLMREISLVSSFLGPLYD